MHPASLPTGPTGLARRPVTAVAIALGVLIGLAGLARPARAAEVGVVVTGESWMQAQLTAQIESWLGQHGHTLVPSPLAPEAVAQLNDCFVMNDPGCARGVVEKLARSPAVLYARVDAHSNGSDAPDLAITAYWFDRGHDAVGERTSCPRCTDITLRTTAETLLKKLVGGGDLGHVHLKSAPPGATITIDGTAIGITPLDWDLPPGKHTIQMDKPGRKSGSRDVVVVSNKSDLVVLTLPVTEDDERPAGRSRILPLALMIGGGAALATGGALIVFSPKADGSSYYYRPTWPAGIAVAAGGAVIAGAGVWLWLRASGSDSVAPPSSTPVASLTRDAAYVGWQGRF